MSASKDALSSSMDPMGPWKTTADWMSSDLGDIRCIISDVDGVMTDGGITYDSSGQETKTFSVRDGLAIKYWLNLGLPFIVVTARRSTMVDRRAKELGITKYLQGFESKLSAVEETLSELGIGFDQCAYVGDDLPDVPVMKLCGLATTPADGSIDAKHVTHGVLTTEGGKGALRELIEVLLRLQGKWSAATWDSWNGGKAKSDNPSDSGRKD